MVRGRGRRMKMVVDGLTSQGLPAQ
jgi:hypothetical protein